MLPLLLENLKRIQSNNQRRTRAKVHKRGLISHLSMDSFTIELVSIASSQLFPNNTLSSFTNFLPAKVILDGQWEVAISKISYPSMYQNVTEGKFMFYDEKLPKTTQAFYLEPGLYSSITDIVKAMKTIKQERNKNRDSCITIKVSRVTQKVKVYLANEESSLAFFSTDLGHIFEGDVRNDLGILLCGKGRHEPTFAYNCSHPFTHDLHWHCRVQYCRRHKDAFAPLLSVHFQAQIWWHNNYWTIHELSDI